MEGKTIVYSFRTKKEVIPRRKGTGGTWKNTWLLYPAKYLSIVNKVMDGVHACRVECLTVEEGGVEVVDPWKGVPPAFAVAACPKCFPRRES